MDLSVPHSRRGRFRSNYCEKRHVMHRNILDAATQNQMKLEQIKVHSMLNLLFISENLVTLSTKKY